MRLTAIAALLWAAASCANDSTDPGNAANNCTVTLSGGVNTTTKQICTAGAGNNSSDPSHAAFALAASGDYGAIDFGMTLEGQELNPGTFQPSNVLKAATTFSKNNTVWDQTAGDASSPATGTFSSNITSIGDTVTTSEGTAWTHVHGSLDATLTPVTASGASGSVTVHVDF